ncbi:MAG: AAA family ATPase [Trueperaceae bacterium]|nr:AAA family ATPase [Trueperaceae bacterium]
MQCAACGTANPIGMRFCGMCGASLAGPVERERRRVSVVFVDLMGFSTLTHDLDPEDLRDLADQVLTSVAAAVEAYDGYVDAFRGDGLIAVFGAPNSHPDDPYRAVVAAEAGLKAIERVGRDRGVDLRGRAGVTTGVVIAGAVGSGRIREYTVMGSVVNLASRLENAAGPGEVWTGDETYRATRHRLTFEPVVGVALPGFPNVTTAYRLKAHQTRDGDPYGHLPFVGRRAELAQLASRLAAVAHEQRPRVVWLLGEAGSGKSRLLREFAARAHAAAGGGAPPPTRVVWLPADGHAGIAWRSVAGQVFAIADAEDACDRAERVRGELQRLIPGEPRWHRLVLASLGLVPNPTWRRLERRSIDRKLQAWRDVFAALAREEPKRPLLVLAESDGFDVDLDAFIELLLRADAPLLVVRAARQRELGATTDVLTLGPLSPDESMTLFLHFADPTFERAGRALIGQVGGIPTAVFELGLALTITQETHFRGSLTSLLQTRLDLLEPRARRLLTLAAVCGERAWEGLLRAVHGDVGPELQALCHDDILVRQPASAIAGDVEFRFRSELLRHAVLEMIPFADRPDLHLRVASWLEQEAPLALSEAIGEHFERGGVADAAYTHYLAAAAEAETADDRAKADRLFARIAGLDVALDLRAQGALTYAQTALTRGDAALAQQQLDAAAGLLARCDAEAGAHLRATEERLRGDLAALRQRAADDSAGTGPADGEGAPACEGERAGCGAVGSRTAANAP